MKIQPKNIKRAKNYSIDELKNLLKINKIKFNHTMISNKKRMDNKIVFKNYLFDLCLKYRLIEKPLPRF
jgi:hypothetical protein